MSAASALEELAATHLGRIARLLAVEQPAIAAHLGREMMHRVAEAGARLAPSAAASLCAACGLPSVPGVTCAVRIRPQHGDADGGGRMLRSRYRSRRGEKQGENQPGRRPAANRVVAACALCGTSTAVPGTDQGLARTAPALARSGPPKAAPKAQVAPKASAKANAKASAKDVPKASAKNSAKNMPKNASKAKPGTHGGPAAGGAGKKKNRKQQQQQSKQDRLRQLMGKSKPQPAAAVGGSLYDFLGGLQ